jgi:hypothetical protein
MVRASVSNLRPDAPASSPAPPTPGVWRSTPTRSTGPTTPAPARSGGRTWTGRAPTRASSPAPPPPSGWRSTPTRRHDGSARASAGHPRRPPLPGLRLRGLPGCSFEAPRDPIGPHRSPAAPSAVTVGAKHPRLNRSGTKARQAGHRRKHRQPLATAQKPSARPHPARTCRSDPSRRSAAGTRSIRSARQPARDVQSPAIGDPTRSHSHASAFTVVAPRPPRTRNTRQAGQLCFDEGRTQPRDDSAQRRCRNGRI